MRNVAQNERRRSWLKHNGFRSKSRGFMKAVVEADTNQILGAAVLGVEGGEIMSVLQVAMMGNLPYTAIRDATFTHPTLAEVLNDLFTSMDMPMAGETK